jgi:hypothetical protein
MAKALAYALEIGAAEVDEAQAWADSEILQTDAPRDEILSLAIAKDASEAVTLLHILGAGADNASVGRLVYQRLLGALGSGVISHERAAEAIVRLARESTAPSTTAEDESWHFDDAFYLAAAGIYGSRSAVSEEVEKHLRKYAP